MGVGKLTGPKKAAILLLTLGEDSAAEVMKNLEESELQQVGYYINRFQDISTEEMDLVLEEFYRLSTLQDEGLNLSPNGDFVKNAFTKALGSGRAGELVDGLKAHREESALESLQFMEPKTIAGTIMNEHPQTISLIMAHLSDIEQTAMVLRELPENIQADVVYRMASLETITPGVLSEINDVLSEEMKNASNLGTKVGGVASVVELLNTLDKASETRILATIEEASIEMAEEIRELMFTFDDIQNVVEQDMPKLIKESDKNDLLLAMRAANVETKEAILKGMSKNSAAQMRDDLEMMDKVKRAEAEAAQKRIIQKVRKLEDQGELVIAGRDGGDSELV